MKRLNNESGFALIFAVFVIAVLIIYGAIFILRAVGEWNVTSLQRRSVQSYYVSEAGAESALDKLDALINTDFLTKISGMNPQTVGKKAKAAVTNQNGINFLVEMVPAFVLDGTSMEAVYQQSATNFSNGTYVFEIKVAEKGDPALVAVDMWDFPFNYQIEATGSVSGITNTISLTGDFTVRVQRDNFAKYALFTDHHTMENGGIVWFTDTTNFAGIIHTNERFSFSGDPALNGLAGIFDGLVTQHLSKGQFYNNGSAVLAAADYYVNPFTGWRDVPTFNVDYQREVAEIVLASSVQKQDLYEQALGAQTPSSGDGIYVANNGTALIGGIFVEGNAQIQMGVDSSDRAYYDIASGSSKKVIKVNDQTQHTTVWEANAGVTAPLDVDTLCEDGSPDLDRGTCSTYSGLPDGQDDLGTIIYVNGEISSLGGTVQQNTEMTVSCENDAVITDHITYSSYTPAVGSPGDTDYQQPNAEGAVNLLGIVSWGGDIRIAKYQPDGTEVPDDLNIHGVLMARNGVFTVDDYDDYGGSRGTVTLLGGAITQFYGAFGLFNGATGEQLSGYSRNFVYDSRTAVGKAPPYFPSMKTFIGFTNDLTDKVVYWEGSID